MINVVVYHGFSIEQAAPSRNNSHIFQLPIFGVARMNIGLIAMQFKSLFIQLLYIIIMFIMILVATVKNTL